MLSCNLPNARSTVPFSCDADAMTVTLKVETLQILRLEALAAKRTWARTAMC